MNHGRPPAELKYRIERKVHELRGKGWRVISRDPYVLAKRGAVHGTALLTGHIERRVLVDTDRKGNARVRRIPRLDLDA